MANLENIQNEKKYNKWIVVLSIVIPIAVAVLFNVKLIASKECSFIP